MDILITAGATRNPIDAMRYISANSSGQTGVWIAEQLHAQHSVHLLGSPEALSRCRISCERKAFGSTDDLHDKMYAWLTQHPEGIVIHAAAVGDYAAANPKLATKIASGVERLSIELVPTRKIIDHIKQWAPACTLISFKAAPPECDAQTLEALAVDQRSRTGSYAVFANVIGAINHGNLIATDKGVNWYESRPLAMASLVSFVLGLNK